MQYYAAADPKDFMPDIPFAVFPASLHTGSRSRAELIPLDLSARLSPSAAEPSDVRTQCPPATSPNLLASFLAIPSGCSLTLDAIATSHMFFVLRGSGNAHAEDGTGGNAAEGAELSWASGDLFTLPACARISLTADSVDSALYYVHDAPLLAYLGVAPT